MDYYDLAGQFASPDASKPEVTRRVLTIMRADEYSCQRQSLAGERGFVATSADRLAQCHLHSREIVFTISRES
ncbi:DUF3768 domain-containing protein [Bradyrhizobium canariense]|uniref:DUF3768 domain-containing protein n=1 Tax=Bradyrhizobium canariense TaxID=255045 RepID=UPI003083659B